MNINEKRLSTKIIYDGKVVKLEVDEVELPNKAKAIRECVRHSGGAAVLLVDGDKVLLVKQFRYPYGKTMYEIPAGKLNKGEDSCIAAGRELVEETGYSAELTHMLDIYPSVGYTDEIIHIYSAKNYRFVGQNLDDDEFLNVEFIPIDKVLKMINDGEICDSKTVAAIYKYLLDKQK